MRLRILHVIEATPGFPLRPGRTIEAPKLTSEMRGWIESGRAEIVRDDDQDVAVVAGGERAVAKGRRESS